MNEPLKQWPGDAVMIVAEWFGKENRTNMESVVEKECRDCGAKLGVDSFTIRVAEILPSRRGRPIKFFCPTCCMKHDPNSMTEVHDHTAAGTFANAAEQVGIPAHRRD